jgi:hypothetical protein
MSISQPTTNGPSHPDRLPIELISAMPPAAAVPVSSVVGICQNGERAEHAGHADERGEGQRGDVRRLADEHQPDGGGQARQGAVVSPFQPPVGAPADQDERDHREE